MATADEVRALSGGSYDFTTTERETPIENIVRSNGYFVAQGTQTEENATHDTYQRHERAAAQMALVFGNFEQNVAVSAYDRIDFSSDATTQYMKTIGMYGSSGNDNRGALMTAKANIQTDRGVNLSQFSDREVHRLIHEGSVTDVSGQVHTISGQDRQALSAAYHNSSSADSRIDRIEHAHGRGEKTEAMHEIRQSSISYMQSRTNSPINQVGSGHGSLDHQINHARREIDNKIKSLQGMSGDHSLEIASLKSDRDFLDTFQHVNGRSSGSRESTSNTYGRRLAATAVVGSDNMAGADFYRRSYAVGRAAVRGVATGTLALGTRGLARGSHLADKLSKSMVNGAQPMRNLANGMGRASESLARVNNNRMRKREARRSGKMRDYRHERRLEKKELKEAKIIRKDELGKGLTAKKNAGQRLTRREEMQLRRINSQQLRRKRRNDRRDAFAKTKLGGLVSAIGGRFSAAAGWVKLARNRLSNIWKVAGAPFRAIKSFFSGISHALHWLKMQLIKLIGIIGGAMILFLVLAGAVLAVVSYILNFISELAEGGDLTAQLDNINYIQLIVNEVSEDLSNEFLNTAKRDAEIHYASKEYAIPSTGISWVKAVNEGEMGKIWAVEEIGLSESNRQELASVNSNLLPIISMMHYRFKDDIDFKQWETARGYAYYMFVQAHDIDGYQLREEDDHSMDVIYSGGRTAVRSAYYDYVNSNYTTFSRPSEVCTNVYIHGYDSSKGQTINEFRALNEGVMNYVITKLFTEEYLQEYGADLSFIGKSNGVWNSDTDGFPSDDVGICNNYIAFSGGTIATKPGYSANLQAREGIGYCPGQEHTHNLQSRCEGCPGYEHKHIRDDIVGVECNKIEHTHSYKMVCVATNCPGYEHTHEPWDEESDPGCYTTNYVCAGHCGGHVTPIINVKQQMTFEELCKLDYYKVTRNLNSTNFSEDLITSLTGFKTIADWKTFWNAKAADWFMPYATSPQELIVDFARWATYTSAEVSDWWKHLIVKTIFGTMTEIEIEDEIAKDEDDDIYSFEGWYLEDGSGINTSLIGELESFYGKWKDNNYQVGVEAWEDFDVTFPIGAQRVLSQSEIADYIEQIKENNANISESRIAVLTEALNGVGKFWYELSGTAHNNGATNTEGRSDCSGFVSGVLNRALGMNISWSASVFAQNGYIQTNPHAGDILAKNPSSSYNGSWVGGGTNHVIIYVGQLDGPDGKGTYIIDCSSSAGGSSLRKMSNPESKYKYDYTACY